MNSTLRLSKKQNGIKGQVLILVALMMLVISGLAALAIDLGYLYLVKGELQNAADAAALAGANYLSNPSQAVEVAQNIASMNDPNGGNILEASDILIGKWDASAESVVSTTDTPSAIEVTVRRSQSNSNPVTLFFARAIGIDSVNVNATAAAEVVHPPLDYGIAGLSKVTMSGNASLDSYDSSKGSYSQSNASSNGDIGSGGNIDLSGNALVKGEAHPGPDHTVTMSGNSTVTGSYPGEGSAATSPLTQAPSYSSISAPQNYNNNGLGSSLSIAGNNSVTLQPGTYYFSSLSISGNGALYITGNTNIYISGSVDVSGNGIVNEVSDPNNLNLLLTSSASSASFSGNGSFYGLVYAPNSTVNLAGNATYYGGFVGKSITASGNATIHRDTSLVLTFTKPVIKLVY